MNTCLQILVAVLFCFIIIFLLFAVRRRLFTPAVSAKNICLFSVIAVSGEAPGLEHTVNCLRSMKSCGRLPAELILCDLGIAPDTARVARLLSAKGGELLVCSPEEMQAALSEACDFAPRG